VGKLEKEETMVRRFSLSWAVAALVALPVAAHAATTDVAPNNGWNSWDGGATRNLDHVLGQAYGYSGQGTGTVATVLSWTSGPNSITFTRVADSGGVSPLSLNGSNAATGMDTVWTDGTPIFRVDVKYAFFTQTLGWHNNITNTNQDILTVTAQGLNPAFTPLTIPAALSNSFTWYDTFDTGFGSGTWSSDPSLNGGDGDHMITYRVTGSDAFGNLINGGLGAYVLCFEDLPFAFSDHDYNDLVVEVSQVQSGGIPLVPVPAAAWTGLMTLAGLAGIAAARRRKVD
jgi:hypothetical protein